MRKFIALISSMLPVFIAGAQELDYYLPKGVTYDARVPVPAAVIGHQVGEWHVTHDRLVNYMRAIAQYAPGRVKLLEMGLTYEARPQLLMVITSPRNHERLEEIRLEHLKLSDPSFTGPLNTGNMPAVVWQGFSIHGNEPSGANASLLTAYHLAAAQGPAADSLLNELVILFDPSFNPDGLNRFATWANMHKSKTLVTDPASREFNEVWPGGRFNHYWFDLNRDWLPAQHVESRNRLKFYQQWRPNILTDHHEMGSDATFFFQPGEPTRVNPLTPAGNQDLTARIAQFHAKYLDQIGSLYYTREGYDDFYYGKGSTYPDAQGCIGILFEQASSRGHAQQTSNGVLRFPFTIRNQFTTTLSTLAAARALRTELLQYQRNFYRQMAADAAASPIKAYVFGDSSDHARNRIFTEMLQRHSIRVEQLAADFIVGNKRFQAGKAFVVPVNQSQYKLIQTIFEPIKEYRDSIFYDITAWTMPLAFGIPSAPLNAGQLASARRTAIATADSGKVIGGTASYAYAFPWNGYYAPRMLHRLMDKGIAARVVTNPFIINLNGQPKKFDYGSIVVVLQQQTIPGEQLLAILREQASLNGVDVYALNSGLALEGSDLGSRRLMALNKPNVAMLVGSGVNATDAGEVWHLLDQRFDMPPSMLEAAVFNRLDVSKYSSIVLVGGNYDTFSKEKLKAYVQGGGSLVLMEDAISWAQKNGLVQVTLKKAKPAVDSGRVLPYVSRPMIEMAQQLSGAILGAQLDLTHPLCFGYTHKELSLFKQNRVFMELPKNPFAAPVVYGDKPLQSGYVTKQNLDGIKQTAAVIVQSSGNGRIICISENPNFRAYWLGGTKLFLNALFFGKLVEAGSARVDE